MSVYYADDKVTLYHGDCREITEWLDADVLVTDPPYGVNYATNRKVKVLNDHDFSAAADVASMAAPMATAMFANHASLARTLAVAPHERTRVMVWWKSNVNGSAPGNPWLADVEFVVMSVPAWPGRPVSALAKGSRSTGNPEWQKGNPNAYLHPTQKPVGVMEAVITAMPGGVVADPFAGSGSTLVAAKALGRNAVGVELDERYCEVIAKRLSQGVLDFGEGA